MGRRSIRAFDDHVRFHRMMKEVTLRLLSIPFLCRYAMNSYSQQLFVSHAWSENGHAGATKLVRALRSNGWTVWFDDEQMHLDHIDWCMANGIQECQAVIVCLSEAYARKVDEGARRPASNDACLREFRYAANLERPMVPVAMNASMRNPNEWTPGVVRMHLGSALCVDGTRDASLAALDVTRQLAKVHVVPLSSTTRKRKLAAVSRATPQKVYHF